MKIKRFVIITTLLVFGLVSAASAGGVSSNKPGTKPVEITLKAAMSDLALVAAINQQVSITQVINSPATFYVAPVVFEGSTVYVVGDVNQWILFFRLQQKASAPRFTLKPSVVK